MNRQPELLLESSRSITFSALRLRQPLGDFFIGSISYRDLCQITYFDVRRVLQEQRDVERYLGIQRPLRENRVKDLEKYVTFIDAAFPTSIIISVDSESAVFDSANNTLTLSNVIRDSLDESILFRKIARVLDGQHRIAGLMNYSGEDFDLPVTIFVGLDISAQAQIFATVNLEQTKVNKSLAYDLFALSNSRSPQKTCHNVAVALDQDPESPFHHRIKRLGVATEGRYGETITQATFVEALQKYISRDPKVDRDRLLRGASLQRADSIESKKLPFRNMFIDQKDTEIAYLIRNYFLAVRERWPDAWDFGGRGLILNKTNGFRALMRLFRPAYLYVAAPGDLVETSAFSGVLRRISLRDDDFNIDNFPPGTSGEASLFRRLLDESEIPDD